MAVLVGIRIRNLFDFFALLFCRTHSLLNSQTFFINRCYYESEIFVFLQFHNDDNCPYQKVETMENKKELSPQQQAELIETLKARFEQNVNRHKGIEWAKVQARLNAEKLWSLSEMEKTGGEPDIVGFDIKTGEYIFYDCSAESPKDRRSLCYDREALELRKEHKPENAAINMATAMGIEILTEEQYRDLQKLGIFDTKTSSWVKTPAEIRKLGGALFCDRRYNQVFVYHNGAESYYGVRGFRGFLRV